MKRHIALVGFMAAGKTTIGRKLARSLACDFFDTDALVVGEYGPIPEIFATQGEATFRVYESAALEHALRAERASVVALGGGALTQTGNRALLDERAHTVFLKVPPERIFARVENGARRRPMLGRQPTLEMLSSLYERRRPAYESADHVIDTEHMSDRAIVENIVAWLNEKQIAFPS